jgi:hypothetical protein
MKTMDAKIKASELKISTLEKERDSHNQNATAHYRTATHYKQENDLVIKAAAKLLKNTYTKAEFSKAMGVEIVGKQDVFDAVLKSDKYKNQCSSFAHAFALVSSKLPPKNGGKWEELAKFAVELDDKPQNGPQAPQITKSRDRGFGR